MAKEHRAGYDRSLFHYTSRTRSAVLRAEQVGPSLWVSPWDGQYHRSASTLQIDHTVALAEAWDSGAYAWSAAKRKAYANDLSHPYTLTAITGSLNQEKGDDDPAQWMPPLTSSRCRYVREWVQIKLDWGLSVDPIEKRALINYGKGCGK